MDWKTIIAQAIAGSIPVIALAVAYAIREWANSLTAKKAEEDRQRMENKIDGNTALTATSLVSSGNLPKAAPCIPAVASALSSQMGNNGVVACEYAKKATEVAHETMEKEGIPIQSQEKLIEKLRAVIADSTAIDRIEDLETRERRHTENNAAWVKVLKDELDKLKEEMAKIQKKE